MTNERIYAVINDDFTCWRVAVISETEFRYIGSAAGDRGSAEDFADQWSQKLGILLGEERITTPRENNHG